MAKRKLILANAVGYAADNGTQDIIVVAIAGPRGGSNGYHAMTLAQARDLREKLDIVLAELDDSSLAPRIEE